jgi:hypothetical protein
LRQGAEKSKETFAMQSNRLAFAALAIACVGAAATAGYLTTRLSAPPVAAVASGEPTTVATPISSAPQDAKTPIAEKAPNSVAAAPVTTSAAAQPSTVKRTEPAAVAARTAVPATTPVAPPKTEPLPALERHSPTGVANTPASAESTATPNPVPWLDANSQAPRPEERPQLESPRSEPPQPAFEELVVEPESVIGLQADMSISSDRARVEDRVDARVTRDVRVRELVAIPAGTRAIGSVTLVERGGKFKERARLGIRFHTLVLADGTRRPITTDTIYRDGVAPSNGSAAKIGGATVAGTILGAIIGGGKGAAIGGTAGAAAGAGTVMAGDRSTAELRSGEPVTVRLLVPVSVTVEK